MDFLSSLSQKERSGYTSHEAAFTGPWCVRPHRERGYEVLRRVEDEADLVAEARFDELETARLAAAVYPLLGRPSDYFLRPAAIGFHVCRVLDHGAVTVGWVRDEQKDLLEALAVAELLLRSPASLSLVLEAASYEALHHAGRLLAVRLEASLDAEEDRDV